MSPEQLSRLFAAERAVRSPDGPTHVGLDRLLAAHAAKAAVLPVSAGALNVGTSLFSKWVVLGFVVGVAGAGAAARAWPEPSPSVAPVAAVPSTPESVPEPSAELLLAPSAQQPASLAPAVGPRREAASAVSAAPSSAATLDQELKLISAAKQEIDQGRSHLGLVWLEQHRQRFPSGVLSLDREALSISARCAQRKQPALVRDFAARHPGAPMIAQLFKRCGDSAAEFSEPTNAGATPGEPMKR